MEKTIKSETEAPTFSIKPEFIDQLHPYARERLLRFLSEVHDKFGQGRLTYEDLKLYLSEEEQGELGTCGKEIVGWLAKCTKDSGEASLSVYPYSMSPYDSMSGFKSLFKTAYERKLEKARQEAEEKKRLEALEAINPPVDAAKTYLTPEEQQEFLDSIPGAISGFLGTDEKAKSYRANIWLLHTEAWDYRHWTSVIQDRRKEEIRQKQAQIEREQYLNRLIATVEKFKEELAKGKKPKFVYPPDLGKYEPDGWCDLELPSKQRIQNWAEGKILERLPEILANLTMWELTWQVRVLPQATYKLSGAGVPCLTWYFESHILVTVNLELKMGVIRKRRPGGYTVEIQAQGEKLGTLYLGPNEWLTPGSLTTPIALLSLLGKGELEGPAITVTEHNPPFTSFAIEGFEEEVEVCDNFSKFIEDIAKEKSLVQALLDKGVIDGDTAKLVEAKWDQPLPVSGKLGDAGESKLESVVAKLCELGWTQAGAKDAVETTTFPKNATTEEMVSIILEKSY